MPRVLVPLAQGCEELEAVTIIDLLNRANIDVSAAGLEDGPVMASHGVAPFAGYDVGCRLCSRNSTWWCCPEGCRSG